MDAGKIGVDRLLGELRELDMTARGALPATRDVAHHDLALRTARLPSVLHPVHGHNIPAITPSYTCETDAAGARHPSLVPLSRSSAGTLAG